MQAHAILCDLSHMYVVTPLSTLAVIQWDLAPYISACVLTQVSMLCMERARALKRFNNCAGSTKPSLFAYPHIGFINTLLVQLHEKLILLHALHLHKTDQCLCCSFCVSLPPAKVPIFTYSLKLGLVTYFLALWPNIMHGFP